MGESLRRVLCGVAAAIALAFLSSCITFSVHPLWDSSTSVFEPGLIGTWGDPTNKSDLATFAIEKADHNLYKVTVTDSSNDPPEVDVFEVHLLKLNGQLFFDAVQTGTIAGSKETEEGYTIPSHLIGRVSIAGDTLHYDPLNDEWLEKGFKSGKIKLDHEMIDNKDNNVVLTASTADLQKFVSAHAKDDDAFPPSDLLHRLK